MHKPFFCGILYYNFSVHACASHAIHVGTPAAVGPNAISSVTTRKKGARMQKERRKHRRYQVKEGAFAIFRPEPVKILPIVEISLHGLTVLTESDFCRLEGAGYLEILVSDCSFYLEKIPCSVVADSERLSPDTDVWSRRVGLKFGRLSHHQILQLKHFIRRHTVEGATNSLVDRVAGLIDTVFSGKPAKEFHHRLEQSRQHPFN